MLNEKLNFLETIRTDGKPDHLCNSFTAFKVLGGDPVFQ